MKAERLSDALNDLDDGIIEETGKLREAHKRRGGTWRRWAAAAACLCVAAAALMTLPRLVRNDPGPTPTHRVHVDPELLPLPLPELGGGFGFEGILLYDISELGGVSPWNESMELTRLPVYENRSYHIAGLPVGLGEYALLERLEEAARALDAEIPDLEYEWADGSTSEIPAGTGPISDQMPEDTLPVICITGRTDGMKAAVYANGLVTVSFEGGLPLPEGYRFTDDATDEEAEAVLGYLVQRFSKLLGFSRPQTALSGEYDFGGTFHRDFAVYDVGEGGAEAILNYSFRRAAFFPDKGGNLSEIRLEDSLACARELGDYPIITAEEAKTLLLNGGYITSAPYEMPGEDCVAGVELAYRNSRTDEYFLPYYRFYVELPEEARDNGLKTYGVYYVPAVWERYIANMPVYDGRFN